MEVSASAQQYGGNMAKATAILLPVLQVVLMRSKVVQSSRIGFYFIANFISAYCPTQHHAFHPIFLTHVLILVPSYSVTISLALGPILLLAILVKYVLTRSEMSWHVGYANRRPADAESQPSDSLATLSSGSAPRQRSIYDNWLIVRFTIAFAGLA